MAHTRRIRGRGRVVRRMKKPKKNTYRPRRHMRRRTRRRVGGVWGIEELRKWWRAEPLETRKDMPKKKQRAKVRQTQKDSRQEKVAEHRRDAISGKSAASSTVVPEAAPVAAAAEESDSKEETGEDENYNVLFTYQPIYGGEMGFRKGYLPPRGFWAAYYFQMLALGVRMFFPMWPTEANFSGKYYYYTANKADAYAESAIFESNFEREREDLDDLHFNNLRKTIQKYWGAPTSPDTWEAGYTAAMRASNPARQLRLQAVINLNEIQQSMDTDPEMPMPLFPALARQTSGTPCEFVRRARCTTEQEDGNAPPCCVVCRRQQDGRCSIESIVFNGETLEPQDTVDHERGAYGIVRRWKSPSGGTDIVTKKMDTDETVIENDVSRTIRTIRGSSSPYVPYDGVVPSYWISNDARTDAEELRDCPVCPYILMHAKSGTLRDLIRKWTDTTPTWVKDMATEHPNEYFGMLQYLYKEIVGHVITLAEKGQYYCDMKPGNVLYEIRDDGGAGYPVPGVGTLRTYLGDLAGIVTVRDMAPW